MRLVPLRRRLFKLVAAGLLPLALISGAGLFSLVEQQRAQADRTGLEIARALATAVNAELRRSMAVLQVLAASPLIETPGDAGFQRLARNVLATLPDWRAIVLADADGRVLMHTSFAVNNGAPRLAERASFEQAVRTQQPTVGSLARGPRGEWGIALRFPILQDGRLKYVLSGVITPGSMLEVMQRQQVPKDGVVSVFDDQGLRVVRSHDQEKWVGMPASPSLQQLMAADADEGTGLTHALEGQAVHTAFVRLRPAGWSVAIGLPVASVESNAYQAIVTHGGGIALSLVLGALGASWVARSINRPIGELRDAAVALGRGEPPRVPRSNILEVQEVADALTAAARLRADGERETETARKQAEAANRAKDEFLAMLGHELRNPLAPIVTALHLMALRQDIGTLRERQMIERQVAHLSRLVDDLLDVSRITQRKVKLERARVDVHSVLARALELARPALDARGHHVSAPIREHGVQVDADLLRLAQVFSNLLTNAAKFTEPPGRIALRLGLEPDWVEVSVEDEGVGIAPELLPRVFEMFVQGEQALDRRAGGLGLGLAIAKTLVEMHGGHIGAHSAGAGQGSRFVVRLPRAQTTQAIRPEPVTAAAGGAAQGRLLIVDDNLDAAESLAWLLREIGYEVHTAPDAPAALAWLDGALPDLIVLDIGLPGMDGYGLASALRADPRFATTPLVALTGYGGEQDRARALAARFDEHLVKPVDIDRLLEVLQHLLGVHAV
jgi:signal transduction histidine kinase/ActR/RegA family two-component response regulator